MKKMIRKFFWNVLGKKYHTFLKNQKGVYIADADFVITGVRTYDNGAKVWRWNDNSSLEIGNYCSIANDVNFILDSGNHDLFKITSYPLYQNLFEKKEPFFYNNIEYSRISFQKDFISLKKNIKIGNDVWIGMGVTILPDVEVGNGVTILAGSVVSKSLPDYCIAGGVPAKILKFKFPEGLHFEMNKIAWWDWTEEKIKKNINDFELAPEEFITKHSI